jgi:succinate-acetate transporter protein
MLMEHSFGTLLKTAFSVYGVFWVVAIIVLFVWIGQLLKKEEQLLTKQKHH